MAGDCTLMKEFIKPERHQEALERVAESGIILSSLEHQHSMPVLGQVINMNEINEQKRKIDKE